MFIYDNFGGRTLNLKLWNKFDHEFGRTVIKAYSPGVKPPRPEVVNGIARLHLDRANRTQFRGTEFRSTRPFSPPSQGRYKEFTAWLRMSKGERRGVVFGFFLYSDPMYDPKPKDKIIRSGDEIDFELLGNSVFKNPQGQLISVGPPKSVWLNTFNRQNGDLTMLQEVNTPSNVGTRLPREIDPTSWNYYKICWFRDKRGLGVSWHVNGVEIKTEPIGDDARAAMPDQILRLHFNIWAPANITATGDTSNGGKYGVFPQAYDANLTPEKVRNRRITFEVDRVEVNEDRLS